MNTVSQLPNFPLLRRPAELAGVEILLDKLPEALLLVDKRSRRILVTNTRATELTGYSRAELSDLEFKRLFSDMDEGLFWEKEAAEVPYWQLRLIKRNRIPVEVRLTRTELPAQGKWVLVALTAFSLIQQQEVVRQRQQERWESLQRLSKVQQKEDLEAALEEVLQAGVALTGAGCFYLYQAEGDELGLRCTAAQGTGLPVELPSMDLGHLRSPYIWMPGKRPLSLIHRAARLAGFSYLATAPLGQPNAAIGLLAIGGGPASPPEELIPQVEILAGTLTTLIQHASQVASLQDALHDHQYAISLYEAVEEAIREAVVVLNPDLRILRLNQAAEQTLGYNSQEVNGQPVENILIGSEGISRALAGARLGLPTYGQGDSRLYRRSGQAFLAEVSVLPILGEVQPKGIVILIRDLSEKEQIQVHAQQLEQRALLGEVTAVFAHEVRNPINNISTGLQVMALNLPEGDPNQEILARLKIDCDRLGDLMKSVLQFSHPTDYELEPVDLGILIQRLTERMRLKITRSNITHHLQIEPGIPHILGNPRALEQVFTNLISNALQAMGEGSGTLALKVQSLKPAGRRGVVEVTVADSGPGIPKEFQDRIFQPFFTTKSTGTGLGLAITKRIVTAHKGTIRVNSFPGGTVFQVQLPEYEGPVKTEDELG